MKPVLKGIDCIRLGVTSVAQGLRFYRDVLGQRVLWIDKDAVGLKLGDSELVLKVGLGPQRHEETCILVGCVLHVSGYFDVIKLFETKVGLGLVVSDPFGNRLAVMDMAKGRLKVDKNKRVINAKKRLNRRDKP